MKREGEISLLLLRRIEEELTSLLGPAGLEALRRRSTDPTEVGALKQQVLEALLRRWEDILEGLPKESGLPALISDPEYLKRIAEVAVERIRWGPGAPTLRIEPRKLGSEEVRALLNGGINLGLIFGAESIYFQDVVLAFQVDEVCSRPRDGRRVNVLGVHVDWLTESGEATRGIIVDREWRIKEVRFEEAVELHAVQTLHLPTLGEAELHRRVSRLFEEAGVLQINPYEASERAEDKALTHRLWLRHGVGLETPSFTLIPMSSSFGDALEALRAFIRDLAGKDGRGEVGVFIQPNRGTEGHLVERYTFKADGKIERDHPAVRHLRAVLQLDDALLREERGNVRFLSSKDPEKGYRSISLRMNVAWDGLRFVAESGYAQVSRDSATPVASKSRGGEIIGLHEALSGLHYPSDSGWARLELTPGHLRRIGSVAEAAAEALNSGLPERLYLKMVGIDLLLEVRDGDGRLDVTPILLEANPRPAGLNHSVSLGSLWAEPRLMVTSAVFRAVRTLLEGRIDV